MNATATQTADTATYLFANDARRWPRKSAEWLAGFEAAHTAAHAFMRALDAAGIKAGFPAYQAESGSYTVEVAIETWQQRDAADALAPSREVINYRFASPRCGR